MAHYNPNTLVSKTFLWRIIILIKPAGSIQPAEMHLYTHTLQCLHWPVNMVNIKYSVYFNA